jgi:hypothetical protein
VVTSNPSDVPCNCSRLTRMLLATTPSPVFVGISYTHGETQRVILPIYMANIVLPDRASSIHQRPSASAFHWGRGHRTQLTHTILQARPWSAFFLTIVAHYNLPNYVHCTRMRKDESIYPRRSFDHLAFVGQPQNVSVKVERKPGAVNDETTNRDDTATIPLASPLSTLTVLREASYGRLPMLFKRRPSQRSRPV